MQLMSEINALHRYTRQLVEFEITLEFIIGRLVVSRESVEIVFQIPLGGIFCI